MVMNTLSIIIIIIILAIYNLFGAIILLKLMLQTDITFDKIIIRIG